MIGEKRCACASSWARDQDAENMAEKIAQAYILTGCLCLCIPVLEASASQPRLRSGALKEPSLPVELRHGIAVGLKILFVLMLYPDA